MPKQQRRRKLESISIIQSARLPAFREGKFILMIWHLQRLFDHHLREFGGLALDASTGLIIFLGPHPTLKGYHRDASGSSIDTPDFDLDEFWTMEDAARDAYVTNQIEQALLDVARRVGADNKPIRVVAQKIREQNFEAFLPDASKSARHPRRAIDGIVCNHIARGGNGPRWCVRLTDDAGRVLATEWVPESISGRDPFCNYFARCTWKGDEFRFCRQSGQVLYSVNFAAFFASNPAPAGPPATVRRQAARRKPEPPPKSKRQIANERLKQQMFKEIGEAHAELGAAMKALPRARRKRQPPDTYFCPARPGRVFPAEELSILGKHFMELLLVGNVKAAYQSLSKSQRRHVSQAKFRDCVIDYVGFADPSQNEGVTLEQVRTSIHVRIEDADITAEYADNLPADFPRDTIVAGLEVGGEAFSREELFLFAVLEGDSLRVAVLQAT